MNNPDRNNGVIVIDKPRGLTSFKAVEKLRKTLGIKKAGHTGTLDPLATGVLPVCLGEATKISSFIMGQDKSYYVKAKLGERTDTLDSDGKVTDVKEVPRSIDKEKILKVIQTFIGDIEQIPPMYSAIKKDGVPLYKMAFKGEVRARESRSVRIEDIHLSEFLLPYFELVVKCSKGTYIRTLIDDIGQKLGTYAHVVELRRLANGIFDIKDAVDISQEMVEEKLSKKILSLESVVGMIMPVLEVDAVRAACIAKGTTDCLDGLEIGQSEYQPGKGLYGELKPYGLICKKLVAIASDKKILRVFNYDLWV